MNIENSNQNYNVKFGKGVYLSAQEKFNIIIMFNKLKAKDKYNSDKKMYRKIGEIFKRSFETVRRVVKGGLEGSRLQKLQTMDQTNLILMTMTL
jgi:hypothetical protein